MAAVGGTVSDITGGKFANGAVSEAFVHLFNDEYERLFYQRKTFGDPIEKAKASEDVARLSGAAGAVISSKGSKRIGAALGIISTVSALNAHALYAEGGQLNEVSLLGNLYTSFTTAFKNPILEEVYDEFVGWIIDEVSEE